jgi:hypothetical protein
MPKRKTTLSNPSLEAPYSAACKKTPLIEDGQTISYAAFAIDELAASPWVGLHYRHEFLLHYKHELLE